MMHVQLNKSLHGPEGDFELAVDLQLESGTFLGIHGASGAGKTSLLRMIAGLMPPDSGRLEINGVPWLETSGKAMPPQKRNVGFLFQDYALFPHLTVLGNLEFAANSPSDKDRIPELLRTMELEKLQHSMPGVLSGGQQQRVALARALVRQPRILLLDEPLSALDAPIRRRLQDYLGKIHREYRTTTIMVSHDPSELHRLADRVVELRAGKIVEDRALDQGSGEIPLPKAALKASGRILEIELEGKEVLLRIDTGAQTIRISLPATEAKSLKPGQNITFQASIDTIKILNNP
ncbi:molybdate transport system ATP-binding protein [Robiginitalea myxolifaciens]|uniref:Molybdate transport system ATP-binding protein n=1 Tax=Robiginitalea myxolifaciens TaxID=400055 RepID=A0A1I6FNJ4_9FLAO|nr:ABC transporter ATP-binding protein [Robiginitalea myxolifaciens]SFR31478.1 molybdate transport system ATP-binding protein [Robiginitalea myxolifaciens]